VGCVTRSSEGLGPDGAPAVRVMAQSLLHVGGSSSASASCRRRRSRKPVARSPGPCALRVDPSAGVASRIVRSGAHRTTTVVGPVSAASGRRLGRVSRARSMGACCHPARLGEG
jgi:hypothetical protein